MEVASKQKELGSGNGFPWAKKINCFQCKKIFEIKFVVPRQQYSLKNNWGFWTDKKKDESKQLCDNCLRDNYYNKEFYWREVKDPKKRSLFRSYIYHGHIQ